MVKVLNGLAAAYRGDTADNKWLPEPCLHAHLFPCDLKPHLPPEPGSSVHSNGDSDGSAEEGYAYRPGRMTEVSKSKSSCKHIKLACADQLHALFILLLICILQKEHLACLHSSTGSLPA